MHTNLDPHLHTDECNALIAQLKACYEERRIGKFFGACTKLDHQVWMCTKKVSPSREVQIVHRSFCHLNLPKLVCAQERINKREKNREAAEERRRLIKSRMKERQSIFNAQNENNN